MAASQWNGGLVESNETGGWALCAKTIRVAERPEGSYGDIDMAEIPELSIPTEKVCAIISLARRIDVKDVVTDPDSGSNAADDGESAVLEDHPDDPARIEFVNFVHDLDIDEQLDLVTLAALGRGDGDIGEWSELRAEGASARNHRTASYLLGIPLLADFLEDALEQFGESCEGLDSERL
jgi:hypothetical protein